MDTRPKVSVAVTVFNLERYIERCIKGAIIQKTDFKYEIIIGEDCSTDRSREILRNLKKQYPDNIVLILNETNLGVQANLMNIINECDGEYTAILDGDDYWIDELKLQKEVDFLDAHPSYAMCATAGEQRFENNPHKKNIFRPEGRKKSYSLESILQNNFIVTSSVMIRSKYLRQPPPDYSKFPMSDWPIWVAVAKNGPIGYIDEITTVYSIHDSNRYGMLSEVDKSLRAIKARKTMLEYMEPEYHKYCYHSIFIYHQRLMYTYLKHKNGAKVREYARKSLKLLKYYQFNAFRKKIELRYYQFYIPAVHNVAYPLLKKLKRKGKSLFYDR